MPPFWRLIFAKRFLFAAFFITLAACGPLREKQSKFADDHFPGLPFSIGEINISASSSSLFEGESTQVTITAKNKDGTPYVGRPLDINLSLTGGTSGGSFTKPQKNADGTYSARFTAAQAGTSANLKAALKDGTESNAVPLQVDSLVSTSNAAFDFTQPGTFDHRFTHHRAIAGGGDHPGTYFDSGGNMRIAAQNLVLYSETLNSGWTTSGAAVTADTAATLAPDGTQAAEKLSENATLNVPRFLLSPAISGNRIAGTQYTFSIFAKAAEENTVSLLIGGSAFPAQPSALFSLTGAGSVVGTPTSGSSAVITALGSSGWYRISITALATVSAANSARVYLRNMSSYTSTAGNGVYLWGAQFEEGATPGTYSTSIATVRSGLVRFDHDPTNCVAGVCVPRGILTETIITNRVTRSMDFITGTAWTKSNIAPATTTVLSPVPIAAPPYQSQILVESADSTAQTHRIKHAMAGILEGGLIYTASVYARPGTRSKVTVSAAYSAHADQISATFDLNAKTVISATTGGRGNGVKARFHSLANGWARLELSGVIVPSGACAACSADISFDLLDDSGNATYIGDGASGLYLWGAQFEQRGRASSFIPTTSSPLTRQADSISMKNISSFYLPGAGGTIGAEVISGNDDLVDFGNFSTAVRLAKATDPTTRVELQTRFNYPAITVLENNSNQFGYLFTGQTSPAGDPIRIALSFNNNYFIGSAKGFSTPLSTSGNVPSGMNLLNFPSGTTQGWIRKVFFWNSVHSADRLDAFTR